MVTSKKGFYVGDICYVMNDALYYGYWEKEQDFGDGDFDNVLNSGFGFAVHGTAFGDGEYESSDGHVFGVDAGVIGIVPLELIDLYKREDDSIECGHVYKFDDGQEHYAELNYDDGTFIIDIDGDEIEIWTGDQPDEDYEDEYD